MKKIDFINKVLFVMNEATSNEIELNSFVGSDTADIKRHIEQSYIPAWKILSNKVPKEFLSLKTFKHYPILSTPTRGIGYVVLPSDFYMLSKLKIKGWRTHTSVANVETDEIIKKQSNEYTRGSIIRPVAVISKSDNETTIIPIELCEVDGLLAPKPANTKYYFNGLIYSIQAITTTWRGLWQSGSYIVNSLVLYNNKVWLATQSTTDTPSTTPSWEEVIGSNLVPNTIYTNSTKYYTSSNGILKEINFVNSDILRVLKYYSLPIGITSHEIEEAMYVYIPEGLDLLSDEDDINIDNSIIDALSYMVASDVFNRLEKTNQAVVLNNTSISLLPSNQLSNNSL